MSTALANGQYPFITLAEAKSYLKIPNDNDDTRITSLINYSCGVVENYIGYEVLSNTYTEMFDGGVSSIFVKRVPISKCNSIIEYNGTNYVTIAEDITDFKLNANANVTINANTGEISRNTRYGNEQLSVLERQRFRNFPNGIEVKYTAGYTEAPYDLKMSAMDYLRIIYRLEQNKTGYSFQGEHIDFMPDAKGIPPYIRSVLNMYRFY